MEVILEKSPTAEDWMYVKTIALRTEGKVAKNPPTSEWKHKVLRARHSMIRELWYKFYLKDVPYYVAMHLVRHHEGCQPYVTTQRNDRQDKYDRRKAPQDTPIDLTWTMNAETLMTVANKRLCFKAVEETRNVIEIMCSIALNDTPEFDHLLVPMCIYHGRRCDEMRPCGKMKGVSYDEP